MRAYVIFDVDIRDAIRYREFTQRVGPALAAAGGRYLARSGAHTVYEGDWAPRRIVVLERPSIATWEAFYERPVYQDPKAIRSCLQLREAGGRGGRWNLGGRRPLTRTYDRHL